MDGVFMQKIWKLAVVFAVCAAVLWMGSILKDDRSLHDGVIRLHVVANSDSEADQALKLQVRDAVLEALEKELADCTNTTQAKEVLMNSLSAVQNAAQQVISAAGLDDGVTVSLTQEEFDIRKYDTFTLPSGVYESLRIVIGEGQGQNWWCVVFPRLCVPAVTQELEDTAAGAGFSDTLTGAVSNDEGYEIRFFLLDCLGKLQNLFHRG